MQEYAPELGGRVTSAHPRARLVVELAVAAGGLALLAWSSWMDRRWLEVHGTPAFCFETAEQAAHAPIKRVVVGGAGLALLLAIRPLAGRWAGRHTPRELVGLVTRLAIVPTLVALLVCEVILRRQPPASVAHFEPESEVDPRLAWRPAPSHVTDVAVGGRTVRFVIDADDERIQSPDEPVDPSRPTIVFTGESVASGWGLPYEETSEAMVAERLGVQTVNVAVQGYANDAAFLRLVDALPRFPHVLATVTFALPAMIDRNVAPDRPHLLFQRDGTWLTEPRTDHGWSMRSRVWELLTRAAGLHPAEAARRAHDTMAATGRVSRARGALPLVIVFGWPTCLADDSGSPSIDRVLFDGLDVPHAHADVPKDLWDPVTRHPDARGQAIVADVIVRELARYGIGR